jgi:hypothetical protein
MKLNKLVAVVSAQSPSPRPRERRSTSSPPPPLRSHYPRARGDKRGPASRGAMPGPRLRRSGPLRGNGGPARGRRPATCGTRAASPAGLRGERRGKLGSWNPGNLDRRDCRLPDFQVFRLPGCHCAAATASLPQDEKNNEARGSEWSSQDSVDTSLWALRTGFEVLWADAA